MYGNTDFATLVTLAMLGSLDRAAMEWLRTACIFPSLKELAIDANAQQLTASISLHAIPHLRGSSVAIIIKYARLKG